MEATKCASGDPVQLKTESVKAQFSSCPNPEYVLVLQSVGLVDHNIVDYIIQCSWLKPVR